MTINEASMQQPPRQYRYYDLLMTAFVTVLLCSNLIGTAKVGYISFPFTLPLLGDNLSFGAGNLFFPLPQSNLGRFWRHGIRDCYGVGNRAPASVSR